MVAERGNDGSWRHDDVNGRRRSACSALDYFHLRHRRHSDQRSGGRWTNSERTDTGRTVSSVDALVYEQLPVSTGGLWQRCTHL